MSTAIYHWYAMKNLIPGQTEHYSGHIETKVQISSTDEYQEVKRAIYRHCGEKDDGITIISLTLLNPGSSK